MDLDNNTHFKMYNNLLFTNHMSRKTTAKPKGI